MNYFKFILKKVLFIGNKHFCIACNSKIKTFLPYGIKNDIFEKLEIVGGGFRENALCPICKANDRERLLIFTLDKLKLPIKNYKILHIAPEQMLSKYIKSQHPKIYIKGDKFAEGYNYNNDTIYIDITNLPFEANSFDLIICNHVLEHVIDEEKALNEINRVLALDGLSIIQIPIAMKLEQTLENEMFNTPELRELHYGQRDHVRLYGLDFYKKVESHGFVMEELNFHKNDQSLCNRFGINPKESVRLFRKIKK